MIAARSVAAADAYVYSAVSDVGVGGSERLPIAYGAGWGDAWAAIRFDLPMPPPGAQVRAAILLLTAATETGPQTQMLVLSEAPAAWSEAGATWSTFGGDRGQQVGTLAVTGRTDRTYGVDVTDSVRAWLSGARPNHGFLVTQLSGLASDYVARVSARERGLPFAPQLVVTFDSPAPAESAPFNVTLAGDTDGDCRVSIVDYSAIVTHFGKTGASADWRDVATRPWRADLDGDALVAVVDHSIAVTRFGAQAATCAAPSDPTAVP